jgi:predicted acetyltransferase
MTTRLVRPDVSLRASWAEAVAEWDDGTGMHGSGLWGFDTIDVTEDGCRHIVDVLLDEEHIVWPGPGGDGKVPSTYFWIVDDAADGSGGDEFVGYLALRHYLNAWLLEEGGHIGYSVRPSRRREGHATRALLLALEQAAALGLDRVLVTADEDNVPSQQVITGAGGVYEDTRNGKRRYWIETAAGREGNEKNRRRLGSPTVQRGGQ